MPKRLSDAELARWQAIQRGEIPEGKRRLQVPISEALYQQLTTMARLNRKPVSFYVERAIDWGLRELEREHGPVLPPDPSRG